MEQFTSSATVRGAIAQDGQFILACFPQKTLEIIKPKDSDSDKIKMSSAAMRRIPDFSILVIPEASSSTSDCQWFRVRGVVSFIIEVKSGYKDKVRKHKLRGPDFRIDQNILNLFATLTDLRQIIEQAQTAMKSKGVPLSRSGKPGRQSKPSGKGKLDEEEKQKGGVTIHCMLVIAVWFACFRFDPTFLKKDLDEAVNEMVSNMTKFCYRPPAAVFDSDWTSLSPEFLAALHQCTSGYPNNMFTITPHTFFQAPQPDLAPDSKVS